MNYDSLLGSVIYLGGETTFSGASGDIGVKMNYTNIKYIKKYKKKKMCELALNSGYCNFFRPIKYPIMTLKGDVWFWNICKSVVQTIIYCAVLVKKKN